jgi:hypothetical protein
MFTSESGPILARLGALVCTLLIVACGGGGGSSGSNPTAQTSGKVLVAVTDADGDFLSYTVDVASLKLRRANGDTVETLPATTRIDFAQYVELTELFTAATVPSGTYVAGTLRLDFSNAEISVEKDGAPVAARAVDSNGNALGVVDVNVTLDNRHRLVVAPGLPSLFTLDFNLQATNQVDLTTSPATVTVTPALVASLELVEQKDLRVRGALVSVDKAAGTYVVDVRPFHMRSMRYGQVTVHTAADTAFEVNGTNYTGSAGLDALATAGVGTLTAARGTLTTATREFNAATVFAGTSVPGAGVDAVIGDVVARSGDVLTVRGATVVRNSDGARFARGTVQVTVGPNTRVVKGGTIPPQPASTGDISVGQSIEAFGSATPVSSSAMSGDWTLDASAGRVRMHPTPAYGFVKQWGSGALTMGLESIAGRRVSAFDFAGTGLTPAQDADPSDYEIATGALALSRLNEGEPAKIIGFPTPFGAAPPDFTARTIIDFRTMIASLVMGWGPNGTTAPFSSQEVTGLVLDLANPDIGRAHHLGIGPRVVDLQDMPAAPRIVPPDAGPSAYLIVMRDESHSIRDFGDFVTELGTRLNGTTVMLGMTASGTYDGDSNTFTARSIVVILK